MLLYKLEQWEFNFNSPNRVSRQHMLQCHQAVLADAGALWDYCRLFMHFLSAKCRNLMVQTPVFSSQAEVPAVVVPPSCQKMSRKLELKASNLQCPTAWNDVKYHVMSYKSSTMDTWPRLSITIGFKVPGNGRNRTSWLNHRSYTSVSSYVHINYIYHNIGCIAKITSHTAASM